HGHRLLAARARDRPPRGRRHVRLRVTPRVQPGHGPGHVRARPGSADAIIDNTRKEHDVMTDSLTYRRMGTAARGQAHTLFAQTIAYVAATAALFALGAWLGRDLNGVVGIIAFIAAFACLIGMRFAARSSQQLTIGLLAAFGLLIGLAVAPTIAYYGSMDPTALWQAGGATALFIAGFGAAGYATRRDLAPLARVL